MTPDAITLLFKEARDTFPPIKGKPSDNNLLLVRETLLPILMEIPFDQLGGVHSLMAILMDPTRYAADHGGATFVRPVRLPLYNGSIANDATTVICICAESAHQAHLNDYASYEAAKQGAAKFLCEIINKVWYNDLKDADTFYTKVTALKIISFLDANSSGLHAINMISLCTNMHQYYVQADVIPQYFIMLEDAQKKAKRAGMPIADIKLVMMASAAILAAQHFPREVNNWEGLPSSSRTWAAWKTAFRLGHLKCQRQILALGRGEPLGGAHGVLPSAVPAIVRLESALENLALTATNDTAILQQLMAANLALTATVTLLTATIKKLVDAATRKGKTAMTPAVTPAGGGHATRNPFPGNYCWTHGHRISRDHMSASCTHKATGHCDNATAAKTFGGSDKDKGWDAVRTCRGDGECCLLHF
jgi:hypothetical protein